MRRVEKVDLSAGHGIQERRQEGRWAVRHGEGEVLDVVSYSSQGFEARGAGEGAGSEGQAGSLEKGRRREVTALG